MRLLAAFLLIAATPATSYAQSWNSQQSGCVSSLRGVSAAGAGVVWASGTRGTYLKTLDGGATWMAARVPDAESLDFRDVQAFSDQVAYLLSIGTGDASRVYKTTDGGTSWTLQLKNPDAKGFFDEMAFWNPDHGILVGDQVDGRIVIMTTEDGGKNWVRRQTPPALPGEGAFAASGTGITVAGTSEVWIGTGVNTARVYHSKDGGTTWTVASTPVRHDSGSAGIFSLAFSDSKNGIAVGGDYTKVAEQTANIAITTDGGETWRAPKGTPPHGFRSAVAYLADRRIWIATGPSGSDVSADGGENWRQFDTGNYNAISFTSSAAGWAVGPRCAIASFGIANGQ